MSPERLAQLQDTAQRLSRDGYSAEFRQIEEAILHIREAHATILALQMERNAAIDEVMRLRAARPPTETLNGIPGGAPAPGADASPRMRTHSGDVETTGATLVPKFKVGDRVIGGNIENTVVRIVGIRYRLTSNINPAGAEWDECLLRHAPTKADAPYVMKPSEEASFFKALRKHNVPDETLSGCKPELPADSPPQLCGHDDGSHCDETCAEKVRTFREYHGLPPKRVAPETPAAQHKPDCVKENARQDGMDRWYMLTCDCNAQSEGESHGR